MLKAHGQRGLLVQLVLPYNLCGREKLENIAIFEDRMANRIDTDRDRPYILTDQSSGRQFQVRIVGNWWVGRYRMMSFRCRGRKRSVPLLTTLRIARPDHLTRTMGRVKVIRVLPYHGRSTLLDCRVLKTK